MLRSQFKTVFVSGIFNILHPGHFRFLQYAKTLGDHLIVAVLDDKPSSKTTVQIAERVSNLQAISYVDEAFILKGNVHSVIVERKPDIVVKGWEFRELENPESKAIETYGGKLIFSHETGKEENFTQFEENKLASLTFSNEFKTRRNFKNNDLIRTIDSFDALRVCVVGDIIVDEYINCNAIGMSREDPTIVVRPKQSRTFIGGAGIVACHARSIGANVTFISVVGDDTPGKYCAKKLKEAGVNAQLLIDGTRPTTSKTRYRADGKTMLRVNEYKSHAISKNYQSKVHSEFEKICEDIDLLIFSDFNYGSLPPSLVSDLIDTASRRDIFIAADSQSSSHLGDLSKFKKVSLVTPTEYEARVTLGDFDSGLVQLSNKLRTFLQTTNVVITLAGDGILITKSDNFSVDSTFENDRLPAFQRAPTDTAGAGDALMLTTAMALATGQSLWLSSYLGALASAVQVSREGNEPITANELKVFLNQ